jgi:pantothenate kinase
LAALVASGINKKHHDDFHQKHPNSPPLDPGRADPSQPDVAYVVPLDGYHLTRKQLSEMPNAEEAIFRRGAAFTFDAESYYQMVKKLRQSIEATTGTIYAPSFDHSVKDPVQNDIGIPPTARIIIFEGLYVAMNRPGWKDAAELMDEIWYVETSIAVAEARVAKRNFAAGISATLEDSMARTRASDMRNAREVMDERLECQEVIQSVEDDSWKSEDVEIKAAEATKQQTERPNGGMRERQDSIAELAEAGAGW